MQTDFQENVNAKSIAALHNSLVLRSLMSLNVLISSAAETKNTIFSSLILIIHWTCPTIALVISQHVYQKFATFTIFIHLPVIPHLHLSYNTEIGL